MNNLLKLSLKKLKLHNINPTIVNVSSLPLSREFVLPLFDNVKDYLLSVGKEVTSNEAIIDYPDAIDLFEKELESAMNGFSKFEQIKKFALLSRQFMIEKGEMTPKMSIVRKTVESNFKDKIDELYKGANE